MSSSSGSDFFDDFAGVFLVDVFLDGFDSSSSAVSSTSAVLSMSVVTSASKIASMIVSLSPFAGTPRSFASFFKSLYFISSSCSLSKLPETSLVVSVSSTSAVCFFVGDFLAVVFLADLGSSTTSSATPPALNSLSSVTSGVLLIIKSAFASRYSHTAAFNASVLARKFFFSSVILNDLLKFIFIETNCSFVNLRVL